MYLQYCQYTLKHKIALTIQVSLCSSTFETTHTLECPLISIHLTREVWIVYTSRFYVNTISVHLCSLHVYTNRHISMISRYFTVTIEYCSRYNKLYSQCRLSCQTWGRQSALWGAALSPPRRWAIPAKETTWIESRKVIRPPPL